MMQRRPDQRPPPPPTGGGGGALPTGSPANVVKSKGMAV